jgi:hypothetical protein
MKTIACIALTALLSLPLAAADNTLSPEEKKAGFQLLFDGKTFHNWRDPATETPAGDSWAIEDGCLTTLPKPRIAEDLISAKSYTDFDLRFEWRVSQGGNTGLKYRIQTLVFMNPAENKPFEANTQAQLQHPSFLRNAMPEGTHGAEYPVAFEMQLIDDQRHPDALKGPDRTTGALYSMIPPREHAAKPAGEWNEARLVVKGGHFEHWINGKLVLDGELNDPAGIALMRKRWTNGPTVADILADAKHAGKFSLQHHGDKVWFKNIRIRELK